MSNFSDIFILANVNVALELATIDIVILALSMLGVVFLGYWLLGYAGPVNLDGCPIRRNRLSFYLPFAHIGVWAILVALATTIIEQACNNLPSWQQEFFNFLVMTLVELVLLVFMFCFARQGFARRLKGFGFNVRTIGSDFLAAVVNFISVLPLVLMGIWLVIYLGHLIGGPDFKMPTNEGLTVILENPQVALRVLMFVFVIIVVPIFEEVLFRGMLQSVVRGFTSRPWQAILLTSGAFALMHPRMHLPALFALSCCMGYAYERSGSLFRPIFIHALFNGASVTAALFS
jgi:membrane protease YdiL (CAAX protease family)